MSEGRKKGYKCSPETVERMRAAAKRNMTPERRALQAENTRKTWRERRHVFANCKGNKKSPELPPMTRQQQLLYKKLRAYGVGREAALKECGL